MVSVDKAFEVRYKKAGEQFEVLVDFDVLERFRKKPETVDLSDVLADDKIFADQKKGEMASEISLKKSFGDMSQENILKEILLKGECQIPTAFLNKLREEKREQIVAYIVANALNPQTKGKYTPSMISSEFEKVSYNVNPLQDMIVQAEAVLKLLQKRMPISMNRVTMKLVIPGEFCGAFYGSFRKLGQITKEYFDESGALHLHMSLAENQIDSVASFVKNNTNGEGEYYTE
ncbi:ribosome assembly factor SBDS [Candidatus Woesearchaeota archaeon]|nr:ribosome assembly factor SBDS [Nanoarchaeota archaeon]MCB9370012.1 ribosome assembly factor SBDS [Candidatus Woesearchaeota archaeon]USN44546.1 MAG: ribosome assembly factor SBDS [Candidatus Woesearchaeota archaeon]